MSGKKMTDVKSIEDINADSGFQSGVLEYDEFDSRELRPESEAVDPPKSDEKQVSEEKVISELVEDSGIVSDHMSGLTDAVSDLKLVDFTPVAEITDVPSIVRSQVTDLPLDVLFQQDDDGDTQLHIAAIQGYRKPVTTLIRICPNKELLNVCNDYGQTALHLAVMGQDPVITRMLVLAGADIGIRDRRGDTPLHKATALQNIECMQALLIPVQDQPRKHSTVLNQKNYNGQACIHLAASLGSIEALQTLLFYGADINSMENLAGWTALHIAAQRGDARMVALVQRCAALEARARDFAGRSPRRLARRTRAAHLFASHDDSDDDTDSDEDMYDEEIENLFEKFSSSGQTIAA